MTRYSSYTPRIAAIVPSAGSGSRFGGDKLFAPLGDTPVIVHTLAILQRSSVVSEIVPVAKKENKDKIWALVKEKNITKVKNIAIGGIERQDSVYNGIKTVSEIPDIAVIHDGARPLLKAEILERAILSLLNDKGNTHGIVIGVPVKDTIKSLQEGVDMKVKATLERNLLWVAQTPQIFYYNILMETLEKALKARYYATDDSALVEHYGGKVKMFMGSYDNIKITTREDLVMAAAFLSHSNRL